MTISKKRKIASRMIAERTARLGEDIRHSHVPNCISDPYFVLHGDPSEGEHDELGYRNETVPEQSDVLCIGDSQTYGAGLTKEESWPSQLQQRIDQTVYSGAANGWGTYQCILALEELLPLRPRAVILALYTGNDVEEALRYCNLSSAPQRSIFWKAEYEGLPNLDLGPSCLRNSFMQELQASHPNLNRAEQLQRAYAANHLDATEVTVYGSTFYLTEHLRFSQADLSHPRIQAGMDLIEQLLLYYRDTARTHGFFPIVFIIPTREYVFFRELENLEIGDPSELIKLGRNEEELIKRLHSFAERNAILCWNSATALQGEAGVKSYHPMCDDGHPNAFGAETIATFVAESLHRVIGENNAPFGDIYPFF